MEVHYSKNKIIFRDFRHNLKKVNWSAALNFQSTGKEKHNLPNQLYKQIIKIGVTNKK